MEFEIIAPASFKVPKSPQLSALIKGILAFKEGKAITDNPYDGGKSESFHFQWNRGWTAAKHGIVRVETK